MKHNIFNSATFCYLTAKTENGDLILTGETKEELELGDEVQATYDGRVYLPIKEILERRDSKSYPKGNNYFYKIRL